MSNTTTTSLRPARSEPTGAVTILRLCGGVALIFLCFAGFNLMSHSVSSESPPYAVSESAATQELREETVPDALEIFEQMDAIQPAQPNDSSGALPPEEPPLDHT